MKKILTLVMVAVLILSLTACGGNKTEAPTPDQPATDTPDTPEVPTADDEKIIIRVGISIEPDSHYGMGVKEFARLVDEYTDGKAEVQLFASATLGNERDMIEGLSLGTLEMTVSSTGPLPGFSKDFQIFDLPYLVTDRDKAYEIMDGEIGKEILATLDPIGIKALGFWENGFRHLSNDKREVVVPEDIKGLKIRTMENPIQMSTFELLGAMPTPMAFSELFTALQQGTMDGQENPLVIFSTNKFSEAQDYLSLTGHVYSPSVMMIGKATFESYPQDIQDAILRAEEEARTWERNFSQQMDNELVESIRASGVTVTEVDLDLWKKACQPIYDQWKSEINPDYLKAFMGE